MEIPRPKRSFLPSKLRKAEKLNTILSKGQNKRIIIMVIQVQSYRNTIKVCFGDMRCA